jgi:hypothetical protein
MAYTFPWDEAFPPGTQSADQINEDLQRILVQTRERLADILGVVFPNDTVTIATASKLVLKGSATSKIIPGVTSHSVRNNADSTDNILITDIGDVTIRNTLTTNSILIRGNIGGRFLSIDDTSDVAQFQITISGTGGLQIKPAATATTKHLFLLDSTSNTKVDIDFQSGASTWSGLLTINAGGLIIGGGGAVITGNSSIVGSLLINGGAGAALGEIRGAATNKRSLFYTTGGSVRWEAYADTTAESGSNIGSNYQLSRYNDAGTFLDNAISIFRSSGAILFTSTAQSSFRQTAIPNGGMVSGLDLYASSLGVPATYNRAGGLEYQFTAGVISGFGIFADSVNLEIKSTNSSALINIPNGVVIVSDKSPTLQVSKNSSVDNLFIRLTDNEASGKNWNLVVDSVANGSRFGIYNSTDAVYGLQISPTAVVTIGAQTAYPSANFTDGANTLEMGWSGNQFFYKQTQVTQRQIVWKTTSTNVLVLDYNTGFLDCKFGILINGAAGSGNYLRGDGTKFTASTLLAGDLPTTLTPTILTIGGGQNISRVLSASLTWNPGALSAAGGQNATTVTVTGAQVGDTVWISNIWLADNIYAILQAYVTALNTVTVQITNHSAAIINLTNRTVKVWVVG